MTIDKTKYHVWKWYHVFRLIWILNPIEVLYDLFLGKRIPKVTLIEKKNKKPFYYKAYVQCPHCETIHSILKWTPQNNTCFGNWFGWYCDHCGNIIPCLRNITSMIFMAISYPFWYPSNEKRKAEWLIKQKSKFSGPLYSGAPIYPWWYEGFTWANYFIVVMILFNIFHDEEVIDLPRVLMYLFEWLSSALFYGLLMKGTLKRTFERDKNRQPDTW